MGSDGAAIESRGRATGHAALLVVQLCFGLFPIFGKLAFAPGAFTPMGVGAWRMCVGAMFLAAVALVLHGRKFLIPRADIACLAVCSFLGVTANMVLYLEGLKRSTATNAGVMMCLIPVFTFAIAALSRQETLRWTRALGLAIALAGASILFWGERADLVRAHGLGNALMALNTLCYAAYLVLSRPVTRRHPPLVVIAWVFVLSLPWVPLVLAREVSGSEHTLREVVIPPLADLRAWGSLAFILVFPTAVAYLLNTFALSRLAASTTAVYVYIQPVITGLFGWWLLGEEPTRALFAAAGAIFVGIWLVARAPRAQTDERSMSPGASTDARGVDPAS
jgi:drug/metabolite transporter (DMT)-like permease